jgi:hypothetical protein
MIAACRALVMMSRWVISSVSGAGLQLAIIGFLSSNVVRLSAGDFHTVACALSCLLPVSLK